MARIDQPDQEPYDIILRLASDTRDVEEYLRLQYLIEQYYPYATPKQRLRLQQILEDLIKFITPKSKKPHDELNFSGRDH